MTGPAGASPLDSAPLRDGVYGDRVLAVEPGGVEYIPASERHGRPRQLLWTWCSPNLEFATVFVGVLPVAYFGAGFVATVVALLLGTACGAATLGWLSTFGPRYGVAQLVQSRAAFGRRANLLPALLNTLTSGAGWVAVNSVSGAFALQTLATLLHLPHVPFAAALGGVVLLEVAVAASGHNMVHHVERLLVPYLAVVFLLCAAAILGHAAPGSAPLAGGRPGGTGAFLLACFSAYAYAVSWNPYAADYSRYLPASTSARSVLRNSFAGLFTSCAVLEIAGAALATVPGTAWGVNDNPTAQFVLPLPHWLAIASTVGIALGAVAANVLNLYSGSMSFLALGIRLPLRHRRALVAVAFGCIGFAVGLTGSAGPGSKYESFLFFNTYWIVPFITVVLVDWLLRRGDYGSAEFFAPVRRWQGLTSMVMGIAVSIPFWNQAGLFVGWVPAAFPAVGDVSWLAAAMAAGGSYVVFSRLGGNHSGAPRRSAG